MKSIVRELVRGGDGVLNVFVGTLYMARDCLILPSYRGFVGGESDQDHARSPFPLLGLVFGRHASNPNSHIYVLPELWKDLVWIT